MKKITKNRKIKGTLLAFALGMLVWCTLPSVSLAMGKADVTASSAKIRKSADTGSDAVASVKKGDKLDVLASKTDSNGYTWYKVYVDDTETGYIRSDLVKVEGSISAEKESETKKEETMADKTTESGGNTTVVGSNNSTTTEKKEETTTEVAVVNVSETEVAEAKTTADVRVRKGAGTKFDVAGNAKSGTQVTVSGVAADSEGKNWYQISFNEGDKTVNGFIREDFLEVVSYVEQEVEEPVEEEPAEEEPVIENQDYYLKYMQNDSGEMDWYLFNNIEGTSQSLTQILNVVEQAQNIGLKENEQISTMRMILIILIVVVVALVAAVTILAFKLRDTYEYEDDDEEDDDDDETDDTEEAEEEDEEEEMVTKASRISLRGFGRKKVQVEEVEVEEEDTLEEIQPVNPVNTKKTENKAWQSKDFLELDDDMEFEFLDL